jgi:hypothetical protein
MPLTASITLQKYNKSVNGRVKNSHLLWQTPTKEDEIKQKAIFFLDNRMRLHQKYTPKLALALRLC